MIERWSFAFDPLIPWPLLLALGLLALAVAALAIIRRARGAWLRTAALTALIAALAGPVATVEQRRPLPDIVVTLRDDSASIRAAGRDEQMDAAEEAVNTALAEAGLETRAARFGADGGEGTRLAAALTAALADVPPAQRAGVVILSDGRIHDADGVAAAADPDIPIHGLAPGSADETDRRLAIVSAPEFALIGEAAEIVIRVDDLGAPGGGRIPVTVREAGAEPREILVAPGVETTVEARVDQGGRAAVAFEAAPLAGELSTRNNAAAAVVNGVRDRLRVLLVSGEPHAGERTWRNLLKSDPAVDLVHFTILRPPEKQDGTPINELSLIAFPIRELFEQKLEDFDLVIFDRFRRRGVLPRAYLDNIARYVEEGGALLKAVGPDYASPLSLHRTPLGRVLPAAPNGRLIERGFLPRVDPLGRRHPVTASIAGPADQPPAWGRWFRQIDVDADRGDVLMTGADSRPLLVLDRVGEGRVAQMLSDQIWLWARGFEGGGPEAELLRRTAHWLMGEPELEEERLTAESRGDSLHIRRRSLEDHPETVRAIGPDGEARTLTLTAGEDGLAEAVLEDADPGLWRVEDGRSAAFAAIGGRDALEMRDLRADTAALAALAAATGGGAMLVENAPPAIRRVAADSRRAGPGWIGFPRREAAIVAGAAERPLAPPLLALAIVAGLIAACWAREGRTG